MLMMAPWSYRTCSVALTASYTVTDTPPKLTLTLLTALATCSGHSSGWSNCPPGTEEVRDVASGDARQAKAIYPDQGSPCFGPPRHLCLVGVIRFCGRFRDPT